MSIGTALNDLDTPSLYLDKDIFVQNCEIFYKEFSKYNLVLRPDVSFYRSSEMARLHLDQFPNTKSVHTGTLSEASILTNMGLDDILVGSIFPLDRRLNILANISAKAIVSVPIASKSSVDSLREFAAEKKFNPKVTLPLTTDISTLGIFDYKKAQDLTVYLQGKDGIQFDGFIITIPPLCEEHLLDRKLEEIRELFSDLHTRGIDPVKISVITGDLTTMQKLNFPFRTEIIDSSTIFQKGDAQESPVGVVTSVMSHPQSDMAYLDCGQKSISIDQGMPEPIGLGSSSVVQMSAEHGYLRINESSWSPKLGDRVKLRGSDLSDTFNLYDYINVISNGVLETIFEIDGRGLYV